MTLVRRTAALVAALAAVLLVVGGQPVAAATPQGATVAAVAPARVTGLTATSLTSAIQLSWTLPADPGLAGVEVRRLVGTVSPANRTEGTLVTSGLLSTTTDSGLDWATTYAYAVFSLGTGGESSAPAIVVGTPADLPTVGAQALAAGTSSIRLSWVWPADGRVSGVHIERISCTTPIVIEATVDVPRPTTTYEAAGLTAGTRYSYRLRTYDANGNLRRGTPAGATATVWWAEPVTGAAGVSGGTSVTLSWQLPADPSVTGVRVTRSDGVVVFDGVGTSAVDRNGVLPEHTYTYGIAAYTAARNYAPAVTVTVSTPLH